MNNLNERIKKAIAYVEKQDTQTMPVGRYEISEDAFFLVQEYLSKNEENCKLESHQKYVDVQMIIKGKEKIKTYPVSALNPITEYDDMKDVQFFTPIENMMETILTSGGYAILYPNDGHMPGVRVNEQVDVRKIVIKVKM